MPGRGGCEDAADAPIDRKLPIIGVVHLAPLPGSPRSPRTVQQVLDQARQDALHYLRAGVDALLIENHGDAPFDKDSVDPHVPAILAVVARELGEELRCPDRDQRAAQRRRVGARRGRRVGRRRSSARTSSPGVVATDQGVIEGQAARWLKYRRQLGAAGRDLGRRRGQARDGAPRAAGVAVAARELLQRAGADRLLVTGPSTGSPPDADARSRDQGEAESRVPVYLASGVTHENVGALLPARRRRGGRVGVQGRRRRLESGRSAPRHDFHEPRPVDPPRRRSARMSRDPSPPVEPYTLDRYLADVVGDPRSRRSAQGPGRPDRRREEEARRRRRLALSPDLARIHPTAPVHAQPRPQRSAQNRFTVIAIIWGPFQDTAIHDHINWCVVGVLEGTRPRHELRPPRRRIASHGKAELRIRDSFVTRPGAVAALLPPPRSNIHRMANAGRGADDHDPHLRRSGDQGDRLRPEGRDLRDDRPQVPQPLGATLTRRAFGPGVRPRRRYRSRSEFFSFGFTILNPAPVSASE